MVRRLRGESPLPRHFLRSLGTSASCALSARLQECEKEFFLDNLLVRIHLIFEMIKWTGLAPWEFEFSFQVDRPEKRPEIRAISSPLSTRKSGIGNYGFGRSVRAGGVLFSSS